MWKTSGRLSKLDRVVAGAEARLGQLEAILDRIQGRLERLETAQTPDLDRDEIRRLVEAEASGMSARLDDHAGALNGLELWKKELLLAVSDGIERTERAERRVKASVARARKSLQEHGLESDALEAEDRELRVLDGGPGEGEGMLQLSGDVEAPGDKRSSIPGVSSEVLRRAHGFV